MFILFAGLSILLKKNKEQDQVRQSTLLNRPILVMLIGFVTATICALTGAGGPILLVPILVSLGVNIRVAVGIGLLNSIVIAFPSIFGYFAHANVQALSPLIIASLIGTAIGIITGSRLANKVPIPQLKIGIALLTILSSIYMLIKLFIG